MACPDYARDLFRSMIPLRKRWVGQCSLEIADDPELLRLAHAAGCRGLFLGIETTSRENLAAMGKQFNDSRRYRERLRKIRRQGIGVVAGMIVGLDQDDTGVFRALPAVLAADANRLDCSSTSSRRFPARRCSATWSGGAA